MPTPFVIKQAKAQTLYMGTLVAQAKTTLEDQKEHHFDPQGRLLVDITLNESQIAKLVQKINKETKTNYSLDRTGLINALGKTITPTTTVSLDTTNNTQLNAEYEKQLTKALRAAGVPYPTPVSTQLKESNGSIIALQQEFHFHLALVSRVYQKLKPDLDANKMHLAHQSTMTEVNALIMAAFAKAIKEALNKDGTINKATLNKALDKARKELMPQAHSLFMKHIIQQTGQVFQASDLKRTVQGDTIKHVAEETTATANDIVHTDDAQGLITLIAGSENTAHARVKGTQFAHRQLITHSLSKEGIISEHVNPRIQIRTPSPVVKTGLQNDEEYINDVAVKLDTITETYQLRTRVNDQEPLPRAFIYNSHTAINDTLGDTGGNLQTQSAHHILQGAHLYNAKQRATAAPVYCFVQNISVNGFGNTLGYDQGNKLTEESTLMAEMALIHSLYDTASPEEQVQIQKIINEYTNYLDRPDRESFFSESAEGKQAITALKNLKDQWKQTTNQPDNNLVHTAKVGLRNLMANDLHFSHEFSKLIQSLSVFSEHASISGCKSGNERAQAINGRVALLDSLLLNTNARSKGMDKTNEALLQLAQATPAKALETARSLKKAMDSEYNKVGLQGAASIVSLVDQGASAKVESKPDNSFYISRNYGEEQASVMTNLHQSKAGSMQAHKSLTQQMQNAWQGHPKSWWERMNNGPLGIIGALAGTITVLPALVVALYTAVDNNQRKSTTFAANTLLQQDALQAKEHEDHIVDYEGSNNKILKILHEKPTTSPTNIIKPLPQTSNDTDKEISVEQPTSNTEPEPESTKQSIMTP